MRTKREVIDLQEERTILTNAITDTRFLKDISPLIQKEYFQTPYTQRLWSWIDDHHKKYQEAPGRLIQDRFNVERERLTDEESELISTMLLSMSEQYEQNISTPPYLVDKAERYLKKQSIRVHKEKLESLLNLDRVDEAEHEIATFKKVARVQSDIINPYDPAEIRKTFETDERMKLFTMPGALGRLLGPFCRGMEIVIQGSYKGGKTWAFQSIRNVALRKRVKVLAINHEMSEQQLKMRHYMGLLGRPEETGEFIWPLFDCKHNQTGTCKLKEREGKVGLYNPESGKPGTQAKPPEGYVACDVCRRDPEMRTEYSEEYWYKKVHREAINPDDVEKHTKAQLMMYGDNLRMKCFPRGTANIGEDLRRYIDILDYTEGFIPDVIEWDYAEIGRAEDSKRTEKDEVKLNDSMLAGASLAEELGCVFITAAQLTTPALKKRRSGMGDAGQSRRAIYAHPSIVLGIGSTDIEKEFGTKRINVVAHRFKPARESQEVRILQQLELGLALIDSEFCKG